MATSRAMMPTAKMPQATQMEMPRLPNGPSAADWQAKINATKVPSQVDGLSLEISFFCRAEFSLIEVFVD